VLYDDLELLVVDYQKFAFYKVFWTRHAILRR